MKADARNAPDWWRWRTSRKSREYYPASGSPRAAHRFAPRERSSGLVVRTAVAVADAESECRAAVQNRVYCDYEGNAHWQPASLDLLCRGATVGLEPALCFHWVMHTGVSRRSGRCVRAHGKWGENLVIFGFGDLQGHQQADDNVHASVRD